MSIFNSKKSESSNSMPPAPPIAPESSGLNEIKKEISSESPMPPVAPPSPSAPTPPPGMPPQNNSMPEPVMPPSSPMPSTQPVMNSSPMAEQPPTAMSAPTSSSPMPSTQPKSVVELNKDDLIEEESLFNLDDFELPSLDGVSYDKAETTENSSIELANPHPHTEANRLNADDFVPTKGLSVAKDDTYFLTTTEFKHLLEQIDAVKERIKVSTQRHMKILSIKAEEDIEIESLKKDFQFIEDKLYEVDSTIFDR